MAYQWTSAKRSASLIDVCKNDLIWISLKAPPGSSERFDGAGYMPHIVYTPKFTGRESSCKIGIGGEAVPDDRPLEFRVNLEPFFCPYQGQIYLDGGAGIAYDVSIQVARCQSRSIEDPTITIVAGMVPTQLPRGVHQVKCFGQTYGASTEKSVMINAAGLGGPLTVTNQWLPLGFFAQGTIASATDIPLLFKVRF